MKRIILVAIVAACFSLTAAASSQAFPVVICVPTKANTAVVTPGAKSECPAETTKQWAMGGAEKEIFSRMSWTTTGIDGKAEMGFDNVNFRLNGGEKGTGNLIIGVDPVGKIYESTNGIDVGIENTAATSNEGQVLIGNHVETNGPFDFAQGYYNKAEGGGYSAILGGRENTINWETGNDDTVVGGTKNLIKTNYASISGGKEKTVLIEYESVL